MTARVCICHRLPKVTTSSRSEYLPESAAYQCNWCSYMKNNSCVNVVFGSLTNTVWGNKVSNKKTYKYQWRIGMCVINHCNLYVLIGWTTLKRWRKVPMYLFWLPIPRVCSEIAFLYYAPWAWKHLQDKLNLEMLPSYQRFKHHIKKMFHEECNCFKSWSFISLVSQILFCCAGCVVM